MRRRALWMLLACLAACGSGDAPAPAPTGAVANLPHQDQERLQKALQRLDSWWWWWWK